MTKQEPENPAVAAKARRRRQHYPKAVKRSARKAFKKDGEYARMLLGRDEDRVIAEV